MQAGNGAAVVLDSLSFSVLYISYLGTYIVEIFQHCHVWDQTADRDWSRVHLFNLGIVHFPHWFGAHLVGNYLPIVKYFNNPVPVVPGSPTSGDVRIEKIKPAIFFFDIIFVMVVSMKYSL